MDFVKSYAGYQAVQDQTLQVFKQFYFGSSEADRRKLYEYLCHLAESTTAVPVEKMSPETIKNRVIGVQVTCKLFGDGSVASVNAHALREALEAWDRGEEYAPEDPLD